MANPICMFCTAPIPHEGRGRPAATHALCGSLQRAFGVLWQHRPADMPEAVLELPQAAYAVAMRKLHMAQAAAVTADAILANRQMTIGVYCEPCHLEGRQVDAYAFRDGRTLCRDHADAFGAMALRNGDLPGE